MNDLGDKFSNNFVYIYHELVKIDSNLRTMLYEKKCIVLGKCKI